MAQTVELATDSIKPSAVVLRKIDRRTVDSLASSIRTNGLLQPILVRPVDSEYEVVFGHHRLEACRLLGWKYIEAVVRNMTSEECFLTQVVENLQRNVEINPLSEADGYVVLINGGWTVDKIAKRIGKSDSYVSDRIGLIRRLHPAIAKKFEEDRRNTLLTPSHLELLARVRSSDHQLSLSDLVERNSLSVRKLEELISSREPFRSIVEACGNGLRITLPREVTARMNIAVGDPVNIFIGNRRRITIEPISGFNSCEKEKSGARSLTSSNVEPPKVT